MQCLLLEDIYAAEQSFPEGKNVTGITVPLYTLAELVKRPLLPVHHLEGFTKLVLEE